MSKSHWKLVMPSKLLLDSSVTAPLTQRVIFLQGWVTETRRRLSVGLQNFWLLRSWQTTTTPEQWTGGGWASSSTRCLWERLLTWIWFSVWIIKCVLPSVPLACLTPSYMIFLSEFLHALFKLWIEELNRWLIISLLVSVPWWGWGGGVWQHRQWWCAVSRVSSSWCCRHHPEGESYPPSLNSLSDILFGHHFISIQDLE